MNQEVNDDEGVEYSLLLVLAAGTGGRWHADCLRFVNNLARYRASSEPPALKRSLQLAFQRRWWSLLSSALHNSIAAALDPCFNVGAGILPVASAIDFWPLAGHGRRT